MGRTVVPELETKRLLLRPLKVTDAEQVQPLFARWEIVQYLANKIPWPFPEDGALVYYRDVAVPAMERGEQWHWTLRLREDPERVIGCISLLEGEDINRGFWLGVEWQRRGLMSEACEVVTDYWFDELKFPLLRIPKAAPNLASRRISEKTGMRLLKVEEHDYVGGRFATEVWEITAEEWQARRRAGGANDTFGA